MRVHGLFVFTCLYRIATKYLYTNHYNYIKGKSKIELELATEISKPRVNRPGILAQGNKI